MGRGRQRYIDFLQAGGPDHSGFELSAGSAEGSRDRRKLRPGDGLLHEYEIKLAEIIRKYMPGIEMFRMLGSGTEAVMGAIRLAAPYGQEMGDQGRWRLHGWSDQMVYGMRVPGTGRREAVGIPKGSTAYTQEVFPNELGSLARKLMLNKIRGGTAAIIVEPLGPESGTRPVTPDYNREVRKLCDEFGALLIFDEVVTGFRVGMGGGQGYFKVKPDLTVSARRSPAATRWGGHRRTQGDHDDARRWHRRQGRQARFCWRHALSKSALLRGGRAITLLRKWPARAPRFSPAAPAIGWQRASRRS